MRKVCDMNPKTLVVSVLVGVSTIACARSPTEPSVVSCSTAALRGSYGSQRNGQSAPGTALTSVGLATFDGLGHVLEQMTVSTNGIFSTITSQAGGYTIDSDCTGFQTDANGNAVARLTVVHGNDEVLGISVVPGTNIAFHFERITGVCNNATLNGNYGFQRNGQTGPGAPLLSIGTITFDGNGNAVATQMAERSGVIGPLNTFVTRYSVNADCTGTQTDPPTGNVFGQIVVVHGGDEVLGMSMTPGNNVVIHYERTK